MNRYRFSGATAIILAGGKSFRMGGIDKSMLSIKGEPMIQYIARQLMDMFGEVIIGSSDIKKYAFLGLKVVPDSQQGAGPLAGILSCLNESSHDLNFITACDIPDMNPELINRLFEASSGADIVVPAGAGGKYEPLYALYRRGVSETVAEMLGAGKRKVSDLFKLVNTVSVEFAESDWYYNLNNSGDYNRYIRENHK